jgi:hypothetical protein
MSDFESRTTSGGMTVGRSGPLAFSARRFVAQRWPVGIRSGIIPGGANRTDQSGESHSHMSELTPDDRAPSEHTSLGPDPGSTAASMPAPAATGRDDQAARIVERALARLGSCLGWGLLTLGILWGLSVAMGSVVEGQITSATWARAAAAAAIALALGLAGWASAIFCRVAATCIVGRSERTARSADDIIRLAGRAVTAVERLIDVLECRPDAIAPGHPPDHDRARLLAQVDESVRSGRLDEAGALLDRFQAEHPGDAAFPALAGRLAAARHEEAEGHVAQLEAARRANDPERVLELFRAVGSSLESQRRAAMERELAKWFLDLIHRRLRVGRIQVDVVHLATQAAETFAATVEGASLRASLPTLRRSVGLCPRCAQPYLGTAAACPQCQAGAASNPVPSPPATPSGSSEREGGPARPSIADQDAGWVRWEEDAEDNPVPPT